MGVFNKSTTQYTTFEPRYDGNGKVWRQAVAGDTLVAKTPVQIIYNEYGAVTLALASGTDYYYIGVPAEAAATGDVVWLQTGGYCSGVVAAGLDVTVGHAFNITTGAVADVGADYDGNAGEFAVCTATTTTTPATQDMMLVDRMILEA